MSGDPRTAGGPHQYGDAQARPAPAQQTTDGTGSPYVAGPGDTGAEMYDPYTPQQPGGQRVPAPRQEQPPAPAPEQQPPADGSRVPSSVPVPVIVRDTLARVEDDSDALVGHFYASLFLHAPALRELFPPAMDNQRDRLFKALCDSAAMLEQPRRLERYLAQLGRDHRKYGVAPEHYAPVGNALLSTLRAFTGSSWTTDVEDAWVAVYNYMAKVMSAAAARDAAVNPALWHAEVVEHELRAPDVAVVTVRPEGAYPYHAGQYATLETDRWPKVWRPYSIANAPRPDGLLTFHVRAVPTGWVSNALVHHTRPGDRLRIGPARGSMVLTSELHRPVLCVAGGTGLAPIKALVEEMIARNRPPSLHLFFGVRYREELYDWPALQRLAEYYPRLIPVPVVSHEADYDGVRGTLPEAIPAQGRWTEHEVFLSGPHPMVRQMAAWFRGDGLPPERLHFDRFGSAGGREQKPEPAGVL